MSLARGKAQINVQKEFEKLSLKLRKTGELSDRDVRPGIDSSYGVGRQQATSESDGSTGDYEAVTVDSTDGLFSFEIMTDSSLIE